MFEKPTLMSFRVDQIPLSQGSLLTHRWRKQDSNPRSRPERNGRSEARCIGSPPLYWRVVVLVPEGPTVRIYFPPARSLQTLRPLRLGDEVR
jgi:hypothetical protein